MFNRNAARYTMYSTHSLQYGRGSRGEKTFLRGQRQRRLAKERRATRAFVVITHYYYGSLTHVVHTPSSSTDGSPCTVGSTDHTSADGSRTSTSLASEGDLHASLHPLQCHPHQTHTRSHPSHASSPTSRTPHTPHTPHTTHTHTRYPSGLHAATAPRPQPSREPTTQRMRWNGSTSAADHWAAATSQGVRGSIRSAGRGLSVTAPRCHPHRPPRTRPTRAEVPSFIRPSPHGSDGGGRSGRGIAPIGGRAAPIAFADGGSGGSEPTSILTSAGAGAGAPEVDPVFDSVS